MVTSRNCWAVALSFRLFLLVSRTKDDLAEQPMLGKLMYDEKQILVCVALRRSKGKGLRSDVKNRNCRSIELAVVDVIDIL